MLKLVAILSVLGTVICSNYEQYPVPLPDGRIVGGSNANIEDFPYQISLRYNNNHRCGGSIIKENIVLTAAHCVVGLSDSDVEKLKIVAGSSTIKGLGVERKVREYILHPNYKTLNQDYDVAILVLSNVIVYTNKIQPIELIESKPTEGEVAVVTGWGTLEEGASTIPDQLQKVNVDIIGNLMCRKSYSALLTSRMLCAGVENGGKDACQGDSGGPLAVDGKLAGVVSWGIGCARSGFPGVYASVGDLRSWILEVAQSKRIIFA